MQAADTALVAGQQRGRAPGRMGGHTWPQADTHPSAMEQLCGALKGVCPSVLTDWGFKLLLSPPKNSGLK